MYVNQAKKRDRKIVITDIAINKVKTVMTSQMSIAEAETIAEFHKQLLLISQKENNNNEVLTITSMETGETVTILGEENRVNPVCSGEARVLCSTSKPYKIAYLHNHPSTNSFSVADIVTFIMHQYIGFMTVVTNQGDVYVLSKNNKYDFSDSTRRIRPIYEEYKKGVMSDKDTAHMMIKELIKGGVDYARS